MADIAYIGGASYANSTGGSITIPRQTSPVLDGLGVGPILRIARAFCATGRTITVPPGWTTVLNDTSQQSTVQVVAYRWHPEGDTAAYTFTASGSGWCNGRVTAYSAVDPTDPFDVAPTVYSRTAATSYNPVPNIATVTPGALVCWTNVQGTTTNSGSQTHTYSGPWTQEGSSTTRPTSGTGCGITSINEPRATAGTGSATSRVVTSNQSAIWRGVAYALRPADVAAAAPITNQQFHVLAHHEPELAERADGVVLSLPRRNDVVPAVLLPLAA